MQGLCDYHTHTPLCRHAEGSVEEYVAAALAAGLEEYGIADHAPVHVAVDDDWRMREEQFPQYLEWYRRACELAQGRLQVRLGLECDWLGAHPDNLAKLERISAMADWDYLIGSVHYLGKDFDFDNPAHLSLWAKLDVEQTWQAYWQEYTRMAASGMFDIMGHADLIKKFNYYPGGDLRRFYEPALQAIVDSGACIELNTAGWYKDCKEAYPSRQFLQMAAEAGVGLVISSDAHAPAELGRSFPRAVQLARECGFTSCARFDKRTCRSVCLPID